MMTNKELAAKLINVAKNYKTLYVCHACSIASHIVNRCFPCGIHVGG